MQLLLNTPPWFFVFFVKWIQCVWDGMVGEAHFGEG